jgi:hypothetical protein
MELPISSPVLIGHMVGGITSSVSNPFSFNQTGQTADDADDFCDFFRQECQHFCCRYLGEISICF